MAFDVRSNPTGTSSGSTIVVAVTVTAGDTIVACVRERDGNAFVGISDPTNGAYTAGEYVNEGLGDAAGYRYFIAAAAGTYNVTAEWSGTPIASMSVYVLNPNGATVTYDDGASASAASGTSHSNGSITTTGAGIIISSTTFSGDPTPVTPTSGFTPGATADSKQYTQFKITSSGETTTSPITSTASTGSGGVNSQLQNRGRTPEHPGSTHYHEVHAVRLTKQYNATTMTEWHPI